MFFFSTICSGPKLALQEACDKDEDVCEDPNAVCLNGRCECKAGYRNTNHTCGKNVCVGIKIKRNSVLYRQCLIVINLLIILVSTSEEGSADAPCMANNVCRDPQSVCAQGICRCNPTHYAKDGQCCEYLAFHLQRSNEHV